MAKNKFKKKYSSEQKFKFHLSRATSPGRYGLKYGGKKHNYSTGFAEGFEYIDNTSALRSEFGDKVAKQYSYGHKDGRKAAEEYNRRTGKQPFALRYTWK